MVSFSGLTDTYNVINSNTILNNREGIHIGGVYNTITGNTIINNTDDIRLHHGYDTIIDGNSILNNTRGIHLSGPSGTSLAATPYQRMMTTSTWKILIMIVFTIIASSTIKGKYLLRFHLIAMGRRLSFGWELLKRLCRC